MKLNKWTVALAAVGMVSLASAARADEKPTPSVITALSATTLSGYVDTSAEWNPGTGNANLPPYKFGGPTKADGFNLDVVQLRIDKPLDETEWAAGYRVDLWAGPDANTLNTQSILGSGASDFAIRQAYVALRMPVGNGLDWKIGVFDSILGYESVEAGNNPNFTRSYGHSIEPQTHTGALVSYRFCDWFSASGGIANTYGPIINNRASAPFGTAAESYKTYMASVAITAPDSMGFLAGSTLYGGFVNGFDEGFAASATSYYAGATLATPITGVRLGAAFDDLDVGPLSGENWSLAGYASWQATEKLSLHARGEILRNRGEQKFFVAPDPSDPTSFHATAPDEVLSLTGTIQYDLWKNVISRLEVRWDHACSGPAVWGGKAVNDTAAGVADGYLKDAVVVAANFIYKF